MAPTGRCGSRPPSETTPLGSAGSPRPDVAAPTPYARRATRRPGASPRPRTARSGLARATGPPRSGALCRSGVGEPAGLPHALPDYGVVAESVNVSVLA